MNDAALVRAPALLVPALATLIAGVARPPDAPRAAAALLACAWNVVALTGLHVVALGAQWWSFDARGGLLLGIPVDLLLGWAALWGALPVLACPRLPLPLLVVACAWLDLLVMPLCLPVVRLGPHWLLGEALALALALVPAQLLARWTWQSHRLAARALMQAVCFTGLALGVLPAVILEQTGANWRALAGRSSWETAVLLQVLLLAALPGLAAVQEFAQRGGGTPLPYDAPRRLVVSGPYAYVTNPMQISMLLVLVVWGAWLGSVWVAAAGLMAVVYSVGLAAWDESATLDARHGLAWSRYRCALRPWWPRWRPYPPETHARLYLAEGCGLCSELRVWLVARAPSGLSLLAAEDHPDQDLDRLTYEPGDGTPCEIGVAALARALEHLHLGWAAVSWMLRLPLVAPLAQLVADASGAGPRRVARRGRQAG